MDGLYVPFSIDIIVCLDTPTIFANSSCFSLFNFLNSSTLFFNLSRSFCKSKVNFTLLYFLFNKMSSLFYFFKNFFIIINASQFSLYNNHFYCNILNLRGILLIKYFNYSSSTSVCFNLKYPNSSHKLYARFNLNNTVGFAPALFLSTTQA